MEDGIRILRITSHLEAFTPLGFSGFNQAHSAAAMLLGSFLGYGCPGSTSGFRPRPDGLCDFYRLVYGPLLQTVILLHPLTTRANLS